MSENYLIYVWRNFVNGKEYIGQDSRGGERQKGHLRCIFSGCKDCTSLLHRAIRLHGLENFSYEILESGCGNKKELSKVEQFYIESRNTLVPNGYNLSSGDYFYEGVSEKYASILDYVPPEKTYDPDGMHIRKIRSREKSMPEWAFDDAEIKKLLLRSFPKLQSDFRQRQQAAKWARIIYLFYRVGMTRTQITKEMGLRRNQVHSCLKAVRRVFRGVQSSGIGLLGVRPRGRPRKN